LNFELEANIADLMGMPYTFPLSLNLSPESGRGFQLAPFQKQNFSFILPYKGRARERWEGDWALGSDCI